MRIAAIVLSILGIAGVLSIQAAAGDSRANSVHANVSALDHLEAKVADASASFYPPAVLFSETPTPQPSPTSVPSIRLGELPWVDCSGDLSERYPRFRDGWYQVACRIDDAENITGSSIGFGRNFHPEIQVAEHGDIDTISNLLKSYGIHSFRFQDGPKTLFVTSVPYPTVRWISELDGVDHLTMDWGRGGLMRPGWEPYSYKPTGERRVIVEQLTQLTPVPSSVPSGSAPGPEIYLDRNSQLYEHPKLSETLSSYVRRYLTDVMSGGSSDSSDWYTEANIRSWNRYGSQMINEYLTAHGIPHHGYFSSDGVWVCLPVSLLMGLADVPNVSNIEEFPVLPGVLLNGETIGIDQAEEDASTSTPTPENPNHSKLDDDLKPYASFHEKAIGHAYGACYPDWAPHEFDVSVVSTGDTAEIERYLESKRYELDCTDGGCNVIEFEDLHINLIVELSQMPEVVEIIRLPAATFTPTPAPDPPNLKHSAGETGINLVGDTR